MMSGRQKEGDEVYCIHVDEAGDAVNKGSALIYRRGETLFNMVILSGAKAGTIPRGS